MTTPMVSRLICFLFGHRKGPWFRTLSKACSQHQCHFPDGVQCYRCDELLFVYADDGYTPIYQPKGTKAPQLLPDLS
ncbi:MAG: hypothetical protein KUG64_10955 [Cycloclasticus sp.]|nr:hypothetical protein [Cycloclasticus sp.]